MSAIEVLGLVKRYGKKVALDGVSFSVEEGDAVALIGPNGAGKTTLLRILATLLKPTGGYAKVLGMDGRFQAPKIRRVLGYMPDAVGMEEDLTVEEYLEFFAGLHGQTGKEQAGTVEGLIALLDLQEVRKELCGALSRGMQQRVGLARTLVHDPSVLLLDEPAANLDPRARIEIRGVLKELRRMGKTIVISSHILSELEELCNRIVLFDGGKIVYAGPTNGMSAGGKRVALRVAGDGEGLAEALRGEADVAEVKVEDGWVRLRLKPGKADTAFVVRRVVERGLGLLALNEEEPGLEEVFLRLTGRKP